MKSAVLKRSMVIAGRKTSISIEEPFWLALKEIARERGTPVSVLVAQIKTSRDGNSNLSSAIRVYILAHLRARLAELSGTTVAEAHTSGVDSAL